MTRAYDLQHWLGDREAQRRVQLATDRFARGWDAGAVQRSFRESTATLAAPTAEAVAAAARALFANDLWIDGLIASLAAAMRVEPFFDPPFRAMGTDIHRGLVVFEDENMVVAAGVIQLADLAARKSARRGAGSINFSGRVSVLKFVKAGGAHISLWEAPQITAAFSAAKAGQCTRVGERRLVDGEIVTVDGRNQGYVIEQARANLVVVQAEITPDQAPLSVEYDAETRSYVGCSATGDSASRVQMIATVLRKLDGKKAFPALAGFLGHSDFFVRWHVMRELLGIDGEAALPHLKRMAARDPHDEIRRAARAVLDRLQAPKARKAA